MESRYSTKIPKEILKDYYINQNLSSREIAFKNKCSENKVNYWLKKYNIQKRNISDAIYLHHNPNGDPFSISEIKMSGNQFLLGLGLGLYWGEGNKKNLYAIRLGNTDPKLIKVFIEFLIQIFKIPKEKLRFGIQVFSTMSAGKCLKFWSDYLKFPTSQFQKVIVTDKRGKGTYKNKMEYGVLTVQFNNKKLLFYLKSLLEKI